MKRSLLILLSLLLLLSCAGCEPTQLAVPTSPTQLREETPNGTDTLSGTEVPLDPYFSEETPALYGLRLRRIFVSLFPLLPQNTELGVSSHYDVFGRSAEDMPGDYVLDVMNVRDYGSFTYKSSLPVFYGLLKETEQYLERNDLQYHDLAAPYGRSRAISGRDVKQVLYLLLHREIPLQLQSVAGAEYIPEEDLFVYDELQDPFQDYYDRGWTLEFTGSNLEYDSSYSWGDPYSGSSVTEYMVCFWYDREEARLYDIFGEEMGYTHNIEGLRSQSGEDLLFCTYQPRYSDMIFHCISLDYGREVVNQDTPVANIKIGTVIQGGQSGEFLIPPPNLNHEEIESLESDFFDDYYHDPLAGEKVTNYFLGSFYGSPEEIDISVLPTKDPVQLDQWCRTYLGIEAASLKQPLDTLGTAEINDPYLVLRTGEKQGDLVILNYYNEILCEFAVLTLRVTDSGYQFVSNLPA